MEMSRLNIELSHTRMMATMVRAGKQETLHVCLSQHANLPSPVDISLPYAWERGTNEIVQEVTKYGVSEIVPVRISSTLTV
jgi:16S rRNA U1498 N3-methylase RsmE